MDKVRVFLVATSSFLALGVASYEVSEIYSRKISGDFLGRQGLPEAESSSRSQVKDGKNSGALRSEGVSPIDAFRKLSENGRLDQLQTMRADLHLSEGQVAFLIAVVRSKEFTPLVRNQSANVLVAQQRQSIQLRDIFQSIIENDGEDPVFRDYSVQFLAVLAEQSEDRALIVTYLLGIMKRGDPDLGGTAALQVRRLKDQGFIPAFTAFDGEIVTLAHRAENNPIGLMGALGALAGTQDMEAREVLRSHLTDPRPHIRRMAIAGMTEIATEADRLLLDRSVSDDDPLVALAAKSALNRITASKEK